ncbi:DUF6177 family protein [Micrococcus sp.]|uniref:DUF6177 family protein n=1 Tax=Micrococcus sp. TaxID=1271 RepID=UPI0026DBD560|nr:DUF6177 family protein [Micrococcus sp.]MDO4239232.1 DUF6177 family protein [Micrococcus sp.]
MNLATTHTVVVGQRLAVFSEAPVVRHGNWFSKVMHQAARDSLGLLVITPPTSALSRGLLHVLDRLRGLWLVEADDGTHYLGRSGHNVHLGDDGAVEVLDDPHPGWLREGVAEDRGGLLVQAESLYPRRPRTQVGGLTEALTAALTGDVPLGWGMQEPVTEPWDTKSITRRFSRGEPYDVLLHVAGPLGPHRLAATLEIQRPRNGVVEHVRTAVERDTTLEGERLEAVPLQLHRHGVRWAAGQQVAGGDPRVVHPYWLGAPVPAWLQFGPEALHRHDVEELAAYAVDHGAESTRVLGSGSGSGLAVHFPQTPHAAEAAGAHPLEAQQTILRHVLGDAR